jgi:hypothetical protein
VASTGAIGIAARPRPLETPMIHCVLHDPKDSVAVIVGSGLTE